MELFLFIGGGLAAAIFLTRVFRSREGSESPPVERHPPSPRGVRPTLRNPSTAPPRKTETTQRVIRGKAWVIDGDTIVINKTHIRLAGIDAPEMNHPYGRISKSAMMKLCKGQVVTATLHDDDSYDRIVATCTLEDGRDLSAELVKLGLAIDWPKFSGGKYKHLETPDARKKMWRADAKQKGYYNEEKHG